MYIQCSVYMLVYIQVDAHPLHVHTCRYTSNIVIYPFISRLCVSSVIDRQPRVLS